MEFAIGTKLYYEQTPQADLLAMQNACVDNGWSLEDGTDKNGYYYIIEVAEENLEQAKEDKVAELKQARDVEEQSPIVIDGLAFDFDDKARERIRLAIFTLDRTESVNTIEWTLADNTTTTVTVENLADVNLGATQRSMELHEKYRVLKEQVMACETVEQVNDIEWSSNT